MEWFSLPDHLSMKKVQRFPAVTAWHHWCIGRLTAGETVLLLGGGVSIFAQFAKLLGAKAIITSSSDEKLARALELGADETINYKAFPNWEEKVYELTQRQGRSSSEVGAQAPWKNLCARSV